MVEEPPPLSCLWRKPLEYQLQVRAADGAIEVSASGGTGALSYAWDNGIGVVEDPAGLPAGAYTLTITDENSCTLTEAVTVAEPPAIELSPTGNRAPPVTGLPTARLLFPVEMAARGTLSYEWDNGIGAIEDPTGLPSGSYTVTITMKTAVRSRRQYLVQDASTVALAVDAVTEVSCNGAADGLSRSLPVAARVL